MREFNFEDKKQHYSIRGMAPSNDLNCMPLQYFMMSMAFNQAKIMMDMYDHGVFKDFRPDDKLIFKFAYKKVEDMVIAVFQRHKIKQELRDLLKYDTLPKRQQEKKLKGMTLTSDDIVCLLAEAEFSGYLLDIYHKEKIPSCFEAKKHPMCFYKKEDGTIEKIGNTDMTDGELSALLEQRKVVQARILHKGSHWHCLYFTFKGVQGQETGPNGSKPHWHYLSDKYNITLDDLRKRIEDCDMPTSKVHIFIDREEQK